MQRVLKVLCAAGVCLFAAADVSMADAPLKRLGVVEAPYAQVAETLGAQITFDDHPMTAEPGLLVDGLLHVQGAQIGERFLGQSLQEARSEKGARFDALRGTPKRALRVMPGAPGETLTLAHHRGFGSMAAFALGPVGYPDIAARGEGALAILFSQDQEGTGLRVHADFADPLGVRPMPSLVTFTFFARDGSELGTHTRQLTPGVVDLAWWFPDRAVAGFTMTTLDPGGIAIDDVLVSPLAPIG